VTRRLALVNDYHSTAPAHFLTARNTGANRSSLTRSATLSGCIWIPEEGAGARLAEAREVLSEANAQAAAAMNGPLRRTRTPPPVGSVTSTLTLQQLPVTARRETPTSRGPAKIAPRG
jgi:hypothetical protein